MFSPESTQLQGKCPSCLPYTSKLTLSIKVSKEKQLLTSGTCRERLEVLSRAFLVGDNLGVILRMRGFEEWLCMTSANGLGRSSYFHNNCAIKLMSCGHWNGAYWGLIISPKHSFASVCIYIYIDSVSEIHNFSIFSVCLHRKFCSCCNEIAC